MLKNVSLRTKIRYSLILFGAAIFLWSFRDLSQRGDGLMYLYSIKNGTYLFHPHHIAYNFIIHSFKTVFPLWSELQWAQVHNIFFTLVCLYIVFRLVKSIFNSVPAGLLASVSLLLGIDTIRYSIYAEVYYPAAAFDGLIILHLWKVRNQSLQNRDMVILTLLLTASIFYHQINVLFVFPLGVYLWKKHGLAGLKQSMLIATASALLVIPAYLWGAYDYQGQLTLDSFWEYIFFYAHAPYDGWGTSDNLSLKGLVNVFNSQTDVFIHHGSDIFSLLTLGVIVWHIIKIGKTAKFYEFRLFLLTILLVYFIFFWWWLPGEEEFFILTALPLLTLFYWMLADLMQGKFRQKIRRIYLGTGLTLLITFFGIANLPWLLKEIESPSSEYQRAQVLAGLSEHEDYIISDKPDTYWHLLVFFERAFVTGTDQMQAYFYDGREVPAKIDFSDHEGNLIFPHYITDPRYRVIPSPELPPKEAWTDMLTHLFLYQEDSATMRKPEFIRDRDSGELYIRVGKERIEVRDKKEMLHILDEHMQQQGIKGTYITFNKLYDPS